MYSYDTVTECLTDLKLRNFTTDFNIAFDKIMCQTTGACLSPAEFEIVEQYRFEGNSDPGDEAVVYAVTNKSETMRGTIVSAYGMYSSQVNDEMIRKLSIHV